MQSGRYLICYFDVLGQRSFMRQVWKPHSKMSSGLRKQIGTHLCVFEFVQDMLRRVLARTPDMESQIIRMTKQIPYLPTNALSEKEIITSVRDVDFGVQQFSDSFVVYVDAKHPVSALVFARALDAVRFIMPQMHALGLALRGAITEGRAWHVRGGQLMGPALEEAVRLEAGVAYYSRIVFSEQLARKAWKHEGKVIYGYTGDIGYCTINHHIQVDDDGVCSLKYLTDELLIDDMHYQIVDCAAEWTTGSCRKWKAQLFERGQMDLCRLADKQWRLAGDYRALGRKVKECRKDGNFHPAFDIEDKFVRSLETGEYYVFYLKLEPLPILKKNVCRGGVDGLLQHREIGVEAVRMMESLVQRAREAVRMERSAPIREMGVQHIGNYLLAFVRRRRCASRHAFVRIVDSIMETAPEMLGAGLGFCCGVDCSRGWMLGDDCLLGPVLGDVHQLTERHGRLCRCTISPRCLKALGVRKADRRAGDFWRVEEDGLWTWKLPAITVENIGYYRRALVLTVRLWWAMTKLDKMDFSIRIKQREVQALYARLVVLFLSLPRGRDLLEKIECRAMDCQLGRLYSTEWFRDNCLRAYKDRLFFS